MQEHQTFPVRISLSQFYLAKSEIELLDPLAQRKFTENGNDLHLSQWYIVREQLQCST
jgi:hypothetical protein